MFPFLIGTVRTMKTASYEYDPHKFPFLIGTVRTPRPLLMVPCHNSVSIPHRYGKNFVRGN